MTTTLTHNRGWLADEPAASLHRIDAELGRPADVNEAGRSAADADANYARWLAFLAGGPWAPFALPASQSVHVPGWAVDSDDWYDPAAAAVWRANGWRQTALYPHDVRKHEPWHGEYFPALDLRRNNPASAGKTPTESEEDEMKNAAICTTANDQRISATNPADIYAIVNTDSGYFSPVSGLDGNPGATDLVRAFDIGGPVSWVTKSHYARIEADCAAVRQRR